MRARQLPTRPTAHAHLFRLLFLCLLSFALPACGPNDPEPDSPSASDAGPQTVIVLTLDALRRDHVSAYAPEGVTPLAKTPWIDALFAQGLRFEDARTPVPLTLPAHTSMFTGLPPAETGVRLNTQRVAPAERRDSMPLLAEELSSAGWRCGAFVSAAVLARGQGLEPGFDTYDDGGLGEVTGTLSVPERDGDLTADVALKWINAQPADERVFVFIHLFEPHAPYRLGSYRADVEDCDRIVGRLREGIAMARDRTRTRWIVTADHGEALGEMGEATHGLLLTDSVMRVPFAMVGTEVKGTRGDPVTVTDIAPTIAGWAGLDRPRAAGPGRGMDLGFAPLPSGIALLGRYRIAESLYGHHRYGWAQLLGAVDGHVGQLVTWGTGRQGWFPLLPYGESLSEPAPLTERAAADLSSLGKFIAAYKQLENTGLMQDAGGPASPYGAGGVVTPFLPDPENARLPDPHRLAASADSLNNIAHKTLEGIKLGRRDLLERQESLLAKLLREQPRNPEAWFRLGRLHASLMGLAPTVSGKRLQAQEAEQAFGKAWNLGRHDAGTLVAWCGINAGGREKAMLKRLGANERLLGGALPCSIHLLRARLLANSGGRGGPAYKAACKAAEKACLSKSEQARRVGTCG